MSRPKNEKDILQALDEMEQVSTELNSRKAKMEARIKKHVKPPTEVKRIDVINRQNREQIELATWKLKNKIVAFLTIGLGGMIKIKINNARK